MELKDSLPLLLNTLNTLLESVQWNWKSTIGNYKLYIDGRIRSMELKDLNRQDKQGNHKRVWIRSMELKERGWCR